MESKGELKKIGIKKSTCYYFKGIIRAWDRYIDIDFSGISLDEKLYKEKYENILVYDISYKTSAKPFRIRYDEIDGFIKIYTATRYLVLLDRGWFDGICDRIKYVMSEKISITDSINHNLGRIKIYSHKSLHAEKILTFQMPLSQLCRNIDHCNIQLR